MARIDWILACDLAFFDREDRLCVVGITSHLAVPRLPLAINQLMLVARLVDIGAVDEIDIAVGMVAPSGLWTTPKGGDVMVIEMAGEYALVTLRGVPIVEEGIYRFQITLDGQAPASLQIPILSVGSELHADAH